MSLRSPDAYNAVMAVIDSDHKPVFAELDVTLPVCLQVRYTRDIHSSHDSSLARRSR